MSAINTLAHWDVLYIVHGLSAAKSCRRLQISVCTIPMMLVLVTTPHMSVQGDNTNILVMMV